jgi:hypothetical protein
MTNVPTPDPMPESMLREFAAVNDDREALELIVGGVLQSVNERALLGLHTPLDMIVEITVHSILETGFRR